MKITELQLRKIIREEFQKLNESKKIKGKDAGNYVKMAPKGRKITIKDKTYISLGKGNWKGPRGEKLNWIEISSKASALGNKNVQYEGFAGPLPKSEQGKFETSRKKSSEVLGYKLTGTPDRKTNIGLTEAKMVQYSIPESDKRMVTKILTKLKLKAGKDFDYGAGKGANFILDLDKRFENKVLDLLLKSRVRVHG